LQWQKIEFRQNVTVPGKGFEGPDSRTEFVSVTVGGTDGAFLPPGGINAYGHPCVRVYILPILDDPQFPKQNLKNNTNFTDMDLSKLESEYRLDTGKHWAQQNISRAAQLDCPNASCQTAAHDSIVVANAANFIQESAGLSLRVLGDSLLPAAYAQPIMAASSNFKSMSGQLREGFGRDNIIVQVRALSHPASPPSGPTYHITQEIGGVVQLFPVDLLKEKKGLPLQLFIGNTKKTEQTIVLSADVHYPPGWEGTPLVIPSEPITLAPHASHVVKGSVGDRTVIEPPCSCFNLSCWIKRIWP
jgi:hypothetical protein